MSFFEGEHLRTIVGGRWIRRPGSGAATNGVGIDTRADLAGRAFVAIRGERHDGHDHLGAAHRAGATLALVERVPPEPSREDEIPGGLGVILVPDTRQALGRMALAYRRTLGGTRVIAITGSSGKTTTKRLVDAVLGAGFDGTAAPRSFNNDIGVPLTILAARPRDRYLVVEIGANGPGEIARLARITEPDIAVITTVGRAHLEGFGTVEAVAREKASLLANLRPGGVAFVNADARELDRYRRGASMVRFGERADADLRLTARGGDPEQGWWFEVNGVARYRLALPGRHLAVDALAAVGIGLRFGLAEERISGALGAVEPEPMRMARRDVGGIRLFNDAYNANPDSMDAALEAFVEASAGASRRVVILGDMLELGPDSPALHRELGRRILQIGGGSGIDRAVMIGPQAALAAEVVAGTWPASRISAMDALDETALRTITTSDLRAGDAVLLKASRGIGMERVAEALALQEAHDAVTDDALQPPATLG